MVVTKALLCNNSLSHTNVSSVFLYIAFYNKMIKKKGREASKEGKKIRET